MAKTIDSDLLQKERDELEKKLIQARQNVETSKNQVMSVIGAIQMTDRLIEISKDGNYSKSRANSEGVPCLLYTSPSPRDLSTSRMPSSA